MRNVDSMRNWAFGLAIACSLALSLSMAFVEAACAQQHGSGNESMALAAQNLGVASDDSDIASGACDECTWRIDSYGNLIISPKEGTTGKFTYSGWFPWDSYRGQIRSVRFTGTVKLPSNCEYMFGDCTQLANVDFTNADASIVESMNNIFKNCKALTEMNVSMLDTPKLTDIGGMFCGCSNLQRIEFGQFDTSRVTTMANLFDCCFALQALDLSNFNTSKCENISSMFSHCPAASTVDFSKLNTTSVTNMSKAFAYTDITHLDLSALSTSNVENMSYMFNNCTSLATLNLSGFDTSRVTNMQGMFKDCYTLGKVVVGSGWTTAMATATDATSNMFKDCNDLAGANGTTYASKIIQDSEHAQDSTYACIDTESTPGYLWPASTDTEDIASGTCGTCTWTIDVSGKLTISPLEGDSGTLEKWASTPPWTPYRTQITAVDIEKTVAAPTCLNMFSGCTSLANVDLEGLDVTSADNMSGMFQSCIALASIDVSPLNTSNVTNMAGMFWSCRTLASLDLHTLKTSKVLNMSHLFCSCPSLTSLNITGFDTSAVTNMASMFSSCPAAASIDFSKLDTSNVTNMQGMFEWNSASTLDVSHLNTSSVINMSRMFGNCTSLGAIDVSGFSTSKVTNMQALFSGCKALTNLNLSSFGTSKATNMQEMFYGCSQLSKIVVGNAWSIKRATDTRQMFTGCNALVGAKGTAYADALIEDGAYAYIDTDEEPGYLWGVANTENGNGETSGSSSDAHPTASTGTNGNASDKTGTGSTNTTSKTKNAAQSTTSQPPGAKTQQSSTVTRTSLAKATVTLSKRSYAFNGKTRKPSITVRLDGKTLEVGRDYTVSYAKGRKAIGRYKVTAVGCGSYSGTASAYFSITPKVPRIKSLKAQKNSNGSSGFVVSWTRASGKKTGYAIRWSSSKSFKKSESFRFKNTTRYAKKATAALRVRTQSWLGKKLYVQIRSFQVVNGKPYYSAWSAVKQIKLKK